MHHVLEEDLLSGAHEMPLWNSRLQQDIILDGLTPATCREASSYLRNKRIFPHDFDLLEIELENQHCNAQRNLGSPMGPEIQDTR